MSGSSRTALATASSSSSTGPGDAPTGAVRPATLPPRDVLPPATRATTAEPPSDEAGLPREEAEPLYAEGEAPPTPLWLTADRWPLFAWVHAPHRPPRGAAVLCPPLLGEYLAAADLYRLVARALARRGLVAVRFDYQGAGDSAGPSGGAGRVDAWLDGVDQAVCVAREHCDGPLVLVGVRSGALMAAAAADRRRDVDALVLWDPWQSGRSFFRRQRALHALRTEGPGAPGTVEVPGFLVDTPTADAVESLRIPRVLPAGRALVVSRPDAPVPPFDERGRPEMVHLVSGEQEALFDVGSLERRLPYRTTRTVAEWIDHAVEAMAVRAGNAERPPGAGMPGTLDGESVHARELVAVPPVAAGPGTVYERAVSLGRRGLFGIETVGPRLPSAIEGHDQTGGRPDDALTVLFVTSGTDWHVGPSRIWVDLARRLAASGMRSVRVDLSGLGESAPRRGRPGLVIRAPEAFDDVAELVEALGGPRQTVLVGLCSGAYQALESALELHPLAVVGINPVLRFTPPELADGGRLSPRRRLCEPRMPWVPSVRNRLPGPAKNAVLWSRKAWREHRARHRANWLQDLARSTVGVFLVCGGELARATPVIRSAWETGVPTGDDGVRIDVIESLDHALTTAAHRDDVLERVTSYVEGLARSRR